MSMIAAFTSVGLDAGAEYTSKVFSALQEANENLATLAALQATVADQRREIADLRQRLAAAEGERDSLRCQAAKHV